MHVLLTGGVGFIGYHLTRALFARGDEVTVVDDFSDAPYPTRYKERNQRDLEAELPGRLRVVRGCVTDRAAMEPLVAGAQLVIHLAGLAGVRPSFAAPARYARVNVEGTATLFDLAQASGVARFVFASSSSVYGNSTPLPAREDAACVGPESPYAASKRSAELEVSAMGKKTPDLPCTALRFFTVYGPRQRPEMAITLFARAMIEGRPVTVFGDGSMRRDYTHVDDIVRGILAAAEKAPGGFRAYNLGSSSPIALAGLVPLLADAAGVTPVVQHDTRPLGDVDATFADITRAREELGWEPRIPLRDGLATVVRWVRDNPEPR